MNNLFLSQGKKGLTLVELLVTLVILSIIITLTLSVFFSAQRTQTMIDNKYECTAKADLVVKKIENSLRLAQKLISGTESKVKFLDINCDTIEYYLRGDTLFNNQEILTDLSVDSLIFIYIKIDGDEKITDFGYCDENNDRILDGKELDGVSGIKMFVEFIQPVVSTSKRLRIKKHLLVSFRNLQS